MEDVTAPRHVEIRIREDGKVVWVNVDGICRFRACRIENLIVNRLSREDEIDFTE